MVAESVNFNFEKKKVLPVTPLFEMEVKIVAKCEL